MTESAEIDVSAYVPMSMRKCGRPMKNGKPCPSGERWRGTCRLHMTKEERADYAAVVEAEDAWRTAEGRKPPACHGWMVTDSARTEAEYALYIPAFDDHQRANWRLLSTWQARRCAICGDPRSRLVADHDHDTGLVRGYLCPPCNTQEGFPVDYEDTFAQYRKMYPTRQLGISIVYWDPFHGYAQPKRYERTPYYEHPAFLLPGSMPAWSEK